MKTVIIGAGASGIYSALILARYGHEVVLLEAGNAIAPLLRGFSRDGLQCDTGFHHAGALEPGGILRRYLNFAGLGQQLTFTEYRQDCCELFRFAGDPMEDLPMPQGASAATKFLSRKWPEHAKFIKDFLSDITAAYHHSPFIDPHRMSTQSLSMPTGSKLADKFDQTNLPPRLRSLLTSCTIYYGTPPQRAMFEEFALVAQSMQTGVHAIEGGGASLVAAFEQALASSDVDVKTGQTALRINIASTAAKPTVTEVITETQSLKCDYCVYTGHPSRLPGLLPSGSLRPAMFRQLHLLEETPKFFMLFGSTTSDFLHNRSLILCTTDDIEQAFKALDLQQSWLHISTGTAALDGRYPVFVVARSTAQQTNLTGNRPESYSEWKESFTTALKKHIIAHVPELADIEVIDSYTEYSMRDWVHGSTGSIYGAMHSFNGVPILPFTRVNGLLLAGQSVILPGMLGAFISAAVACGSVVGYNQLFKDLACTSAEL
jgi:all-trans-retinol 13,14-reductase